MKKETWKPVTISGFTGILMGAASAYGVQTVMNNEQSAPEQEAKTSDYDGMSFKDAFEAARAEMGPGHVFTWHGNVYNTYTAAEWNAKTHQEQEKFAEQVEPQLASAGAEEPEGPATEVPVEEAPAGLTAGTQSTQEVPEPVEDIVIGGDEGVDVVVRTPDDEKIAEAGSNEDVDVAVRAIDDEKIPEEGANNTSADDNDVRVLGYGNVELPDGDVVTVEELEMNGQRVAIIDLDKDGVPDVAMSDLNHNQKADEGEVIDLHTGETLSFTNDTDDVTDVFTPTEI